MVVQQIQNGIYHSLAQIDQVVQSVDNFISLSSTDCLALFHARSGSGDVQKEHSKESAIREINNQLNLLQRQLRRGHPVSYAEQLGRSLASAIDTDRTYTNLSKISEGTDFPDLGSQISNLFCTIDQLLGYRKNYTKPAAKRETKKRIINQRDADDIIDRQRFMITAAIKKIASALASIFDPLTDKQKSVIDLLVTREHSGLGSFMGTKIDSDLSSLRKLLRFGKKPTQELRAKYTKRTENTTKPSSNKIIAIRDEDEEDGIYRIYVTGCLKDGQRTYFALAKKGRAVNGDPNFCYFTLINDVSILNKGTVIEARITD